MPRAPRPAAAASAKDGILEDRERLIRRLDTGSEQLGCGLRDKRVSHGPCWRGIRTRT